MATPIDPDIKAFLEEILKDGGMEELDGELRDGVLNELKERLDVFIENITIKHMAEKHRGTFRTMVKEQRDPEEIEKFVVEHVQNAEKLISNAFSEFRELYGGKGK